MSLSLSPANLALRAVAVYLIVLLLLRLAGKKQLGQMGPTEFVAMLLISNAVQNSMNGGDNSLLGGLILAAILIFLSWAISYLTYRSRWLSRVFEGSPSLLIHHGQVVRPSLVKERMTERELMALLRKQGVHRIHDVESAVLESDGTFSLIRTSELNPS